MHFADYTVTLANWLKAKRNSSIERSSWEDHRMSSGCTPRAAGGFGDEFAIIILPAYLSELGFARQWRCRVESMPFPAPFGRDRSRAKTKDSLWPVVGDEARWLLTSRWLKAARHGLRMGVSTWTFRV
jgi:hypothetical protein